MAPVAGGSNQPPPFENVNLFTSDIPLREATTRAGVDARALAGFGADYGSAETMELGRLANENPPRLRMFEPNGERADRVDLHPAYHALMRKSMAAGLHGSTGDIVERAAQLYMATQIEAGHICPLTMTSAAGAALKAAPEILAAWLPYTAARDYDDAFKPWFTKRSATLGMGMTERQSGTDVRATITEAKPHNGHYEITGHKWFLSAPMSDGFLALAQAPEGLTCFLLPRFRPDGSVNALRLQRLKDKLGNRSNASAEVEFFGAYAERIGAEGEGVRTILNMVQLTRLDCAVAAAGQMRFGLALALHHARHRFVFNRPLIEQPLMRAVLADLALSSEANTALVFRLARAYANPLDGAYARLMTPAVKYLVAKMAPAFIYETLECLGGNGYVENFPMARLYREAPLNAIWEGSGNVMALDVLRALRKGDAGVIDTLADACGAPGKAVADEIRRFASGEDAEIHARIIAEKLARLGALAALHEANGALAEACAARGAHATWGAGDLRGVEALVLSRVLAE
ncbi:MAG: acyl-CoA dehydrogenase family protein [Methylocella sp.]